MTNMTVVMGRSPREDGGARNLFTARSGQFTNGSMTLRRQTERLPGDGLAKEFAVLRGETGDNPLDMLNNTVDIADLQHYQTTRPSAKRFGSQEDGVIITDRSLPDSCGIRQSGQQGVTGVVKTEGEELGNEVAASFSLQAQHLELTQEIEEQKAVISDLVD